MGSLEAEGRGSGPALKDILQDQGVALAEETFDSSLSKSQCMAYELCNFGANAPEAQDPEYTPAMNALTEFLTSMKESAARETKNIDSLLAAVQVGRALGSSACADLYVCERPRPRGTSAPASPSPAPCAASTPPRCVAAPACSPASTAAPPVTHARLVTPPVYTSHHTLYDMNITCIIAS